MTTLGSVYIGFCVSRGSVSPSLALVSHAYTRYTQPRTLHCYSHSACAAAGCASDGWTGRERVVRERQDRTDGGCRFGPERYDGLQDLPAPGMAAATVCRAQPYE